MKLIVGLGNPGQNYKNTRHNMGFMAVDHYVNKKKLGDFKEKFNALYLDTVINDQKIVFLKPLTYMNLSGEAVIKFINYFKISIDDILVISDDLDMPLGKLKLKSSGSSGGHNGLKSISLSIGTDVYKRLKLGIGNNKNIDTCDYVLGKFSDNENKIIDKQMDEVLNIIDDYLSINFDRLMNKYNVKKKEVNDV